MFHQSELEKAIAFSSGIENGDLSIDSQSVLHVAEESEETKSIFSLLWRQLYSVDIRVLL